MASWYTATARESRPHRFECDRCGCRAHVVATASARGSAMITALGDRGAHRAASERAEEAAARAAAHNVRVVACPRCHARRTSALIATALIPALHLFWLAPVLGGLALFADVMMGDAGSHTVAAFALGALAALPVVALLVRRKLRLADESVQFIEIRFE